MAVTDEIHVYSRYFALLHEKSKVPHTELVQETMDEMVCPVVNTSLTTAIGFVSFAFSPLGPVVVFGQSRWAATAAFIAVSFVWAVHHPLTRIGTNPLRLHPGDPKNAAHPLTNQNAPARPP